MSNEKDSSNRPPKKTRSFSLITYLSAPAVAEVLRRNDTKIRAYAYCEHDKDINEDLTPKQRHIHIVLQLVNATTVNSVKRWFGGYFDEKHQEVNTLAQITHDVQASFDYLTHNTEQAKADGKYIYSENSVVTNDRQYFESETAGHDDTMLMAFNDMLDGIPLVEIVQRYGRDFIVHYGHIKTLFNDVQKQTGGVLL